MPRSSSLLSRSLLSVFIFSVSVLSLLLLVPLSAQACGCGSHLGEEEREVPEPFVPTREFQPLLENQAVPPGLHVRLNMATGQREAKLLDPEEDHPGLDVKDTSVVLADPEEAERRDRVGELMDGLKRAASTEQDDLIEAIRVLRSFERGEEEGKDEERILQALEKLEPLVRFYDHGLTLIKLDGAQPLIKALAHPSQAVRLEVANVLGAGLQSNPAVQKSFLAKGLLDRLFQRLKDEEETSVRARLLLPLSTLLRGFPEGTAAFVEREGLQWLAGLHDEGASGPLFRKKLVTLVSDLVREEVEAEEQSSVLRSGLEGKGWCDRLARLMMEEDLDSVEKSLEATQLLKSCQGSQEIEKALARVGQLLQEKKEELSAEYLEDLRLLFNEAESAWRA